MPKSNLNTAENLAVVTQPESPKIEQSDRNKENLKPGWNARKRSYFIPETTNEQGETIKSHREPLQIGAEIYQKTIAEITLPESHAKFPTDQRIIVRIEKDPNSPHDIVIALFGGWGETTENFSGHFMKILLETLASKGYQNPLILGLNAAGRGTQKYMENQEKVFNITLGREFADMEALAAYLTTQENTFNEDAPIIPISHSMGYPDALAFIKGLANSEKTEKTKPEITNETKKFHKQISNVIGIRPVTDRPGAMLNLNFLTQLLNKVPQAVWQLIKRKGALDLERKDYAKKMFAGNQEKADEAIQFTTPDSDPRFLQVTALLWQGFFRGLFGRLFADAYKILQENGAKVTIAQGAHDQLITKTMGKDVETLQAAGINAQLVEMAGAAHSIAINMNEEEYLSTQELLEENIPEKQLQAA